MTQPSAAARLDRYRRTPAWRRLLSGVLDGMTPSLFESGAYGYPYRSTTEAIRGDWMRVGKDIETVMVRELEAAQKTGAE